MIPYGRQTIDDDDIAAVVATLRSDWLTGGPRVDDFEKTLAAYTGARHAVAFSNGTAALHGALATAGIGHGDRVLTSPLSFVASANCARYVGARAGFVDIDPHTLNLDPAKVGPCDALVAVHYAGLPVDLRALPERPAIIVEDAAHALGARTPDGSVGNCARSDMCTFSFHPVKALTTAEGGAVTTNSDDLADALRRFRSHGTVPKPEHGGWYYEVETLGFNYRLTDLQAALGLSQIPKLDAFVARRNDLAARYRMRLTGLPIELPPAAPAASGTRTTCSPCACPSVVPSTTRCASEASACRCTTCRSTSTRCTRRPVAVPSTSPTPSGRTKGCSRCRCTRSSARTSKTV